MIYLLLAVGFVLLIKGADWFVDGSSAMARRLRIPSVIIGLTIVAMGTSAPEAAVSFTASLTGNSDISLGNIVGSNIFNLLMVIGICAVIFPVISNREILRRDMIWNILIALVLLVLLLDRKLSRLDGGLLLLIFVTYLTVLIRSACHNRTDEKDRAEASRGIPPVWRMVLLILLGLAAVVLGGRMVVENASLIAARLGMSDALIGLTVVAIGTSLPELTTSIVASHKGDSGIAIGNAVGSCIFNILFILGLASLLKPMHAIPELVIDVGILTGISAVLFLFAKTGERTSRWEGIFCIALYLIYTGYIILR